MNSYKFSNKLICCDAVVGLETLPDESIPLAVTSPPWDDMRKFGEHPWNFKAVARQLWRVVRQGGVVCWHVADQVKDFSETLTSFRQALYFQKLGFYVNTIVVDAHTPGTRQFRYGNAVQFVFVLSKGKPNVFNPISDVPNESAGKVKIFHSRDANGDSHHSSPKIVKPYRVKDAVWLCTNGGHSDRDLTKHHPAVFNERLVRDLIRSYSVTGNVVLDCFSGVGTTAKIALLNNRRYLGFEIYQFYHDLAVKRLEPRPFFRNQTQSWYVQIDGKQVNLGRDEAEARRQYHDLMTKRREAAPPGLDTVRGVLNEYLAFAEANRSKRTFEVALAHLTSFLNHVGRLKLSKLKPYHVQSWLDSCYTVRAGDASDCWM